MSGQASGDRFYARGFAFACLGAAVVLALSVGTMVSRADSSEQWVKPAWVVFTVVVGFWLIAFGVSFLLLPYAEVRSDRLVIRSLGIRRVYAFDGTEQLERRTGAVQLIELATGRPSAQVLTIILGATATRFESALQEALDAKRSGTASP